jgi:amino acid transporter
VIRRPLGFVDLALTGVAMTLSIRWIATAAAAGPASLPLWGLAALGFMAPLALATADLTTLIDGDGGIYAWTCEALGETTGFVCGWLYWTCNLPYFSGLLYFIVNAAAAACGARVETAVADPSAFAIIAIAVAAAVGTLHLAGLGTGKWLANFGAGAGCLLLAAIVGAGAVLVLKHGPATHFAGASYAPPLDADGAALWATMVFAFGGPEALALLRGDVKGGTARILQALAVVGVLLALAYAAGTAAMLSILPPKEISRLSGVPEAIRSACERLGLAGLAPVALVLLAASMLGAYSAWFGVAAKLPLVIGLGRSFPAVFARKGGRPGAPVAAILIQTAAVIALIGLGQAGASVKAAYDFLISMSVISYTLPFALLFIAWLRLQGRPRPAGAWRLPGGAAPARIAGVVGLALTSSAIFCTLVPSPEAADKLAAFVKLVVASAVLVLSGLAVQLLAGRPSAPGSSRPS